MKVKETSLHGVKLIEPTVFGDHRGFFMESYTKTAFEKHALNFEFIQDNHSLSIEANVIRGMHYQLEPKAQTKLVRVSAGEIYDVIIDLRHGSLLLVNGKGLFFQLQISCSF